jgi:hypothetical protein
MLRKLARNILSILVSKVELTDENWGEGSGGRGGMGGGGANSYDREKAWSFINYSILSGQPVR